MANERMGMETVTSTRRRKGLDDLIGCLVDEVALCGDGGASPEQFTTFVHSFYNDPSSSSQTIDRPFLSASWQWLTQHPHINVSGATSSTPSPTLTAAEAASPPLRLFTTQTRIWLAITGHEPARNKVHPSEIELLTIIASRKGTGILQTELVKSSGQDKRSVPKRTDALATKGYIDKRTVLTANARTSLCVLKRFVNESQRVIVIDVPKEDGREAGRMIDLQELGKGIVGALRGKESVRPTAVKELLRCARDDSFFKRHITFTIRRLQYSGCVQKLRGYFLDDKGIVRHPRVLRLLREPTEAEWRGFQEPVPSSFGKLKQKYDDDDDDDDGNDGLGSENEQYDKLENSTPTPAPDADQTTKLVQEEKIIPIWTPDRTLHHIIFDLVRQSGTDGISTMEVTKTVAGPFFRRVVEIILNKMAEHWQLSQPLHLRHLAIIKDTAITNGLAHFHYYTYLNFQKLVKRGEKSWEAVTIPTKQKYRSKKAVAHAIGALPELDVFGFPKLSPGEFALSDAPGSLELVRDVPKVKKPKSKPTTVISDKPKGRPRKYPASGIPDDIERWKDQDIRRFERSRAYAYQYAVRKAREQHESLTADGIEPQTAEEQAKQASVIKEAREDYEALRRKLDEFMPLARGGMRTRKAAKGRLQKINNAQKRTNTPATAVEVPYLPSIIAHTHPLILWEPVKPKRVYNKRKRESTDLTTPMPKRGRFGEIGSSEPLMIENSNVSQTSRTGRVITPSKRLESIDESSTEAEAPPARSRTRDPIYDIPRIVTREEQVEKLRNNDAGQQVCLIGELYAKTPKGGRGRPRRSQLLLLRSRKLREFSWFKVQEEAVLIAAAPVHPVKIVDLSLTLTEAEQQQQLIDEDSDPNENPDQVDETPIGDGIMGEASRSMHKAGASRKRSLADRGTYGPSPTTLRNRKGTDLDTKNISTVIRNDLSPAPVVQAQSLQMSTSVEQTPRLDQTPSMNEVPHMSPIPNHNVRGSSQDVFSSAGQSHARDSTLEKSTASRPPSQSDVATPAPGSPMPLSEATLSSKKRPVKNPRLTIGGGSIALLRRNIVMDLINQCDGVSPDTTALSVAFSEEWLKRGQTGKPDVKTCKNAVKGLIDSGTLQRFQFGFQTPQGVNAIRGMLVISGIDRNDKRVKDLEEKMTALHPNTYFPDCWDIGDRRVQKSEGNQGPTTAESEKADTSVLSLDSAGPGRRESTLADQQKNADRDYAVQRAHELLKDKEFSQLTISELKVYEALVRDAGPAGLAMLPNSSFKKLRQEKRKDEAHSERTKTGMRRAKERLASIVERNMPKALPREVALQNQVSSERKRRVEQDSSSQHIRKRVRFAKARKKDIINADETSSESNESHEQVDGTSSVGLDLDSSNDIARGNAANLTPWETFNRHVNLDLAAETKSVTSSVVRDRHGEFVNYQPVEDFKGAFSGSIDMNGMFRCQYTEDGSGNRIRLSTKRLNPSFVPEGDRQEPRSSAQSSVSSVGQSHRWVPESQRADRIDENARSPSTSRLKKRQSQSTVRVRRIKELQQTPPQGTTPDLINANTELPPQIRRTRKSVGQDRRSVQNFGEENTFRLMAAVSIIRCLTGGMKQYIDWSLVELVFPGYDQQVLNQRWRFCQATYQLHIEKFLADFQDVFASAYEVGEIPSIDLDHPETIDWTYLTDWAIKTVEGGAGTGYYNLPQEREALDRLCVLEPTSQPTMATFFEQDAPSTIARRKTNLYAQAWGTSLHASSVSPTPHDDKNPRLRVLKSWIRANVISPEETYRPSLAREKLAYFPSPMVDMAIKQMLESRILTQENKGRLIPGRNYDISVIVLRQLKKAGNPQTLKAAVEFKEHLDTVLFSHHAISAQHGEHHELELDCVAHDHIALVILNLVANGRCSLRPVNPPREKWGLCGDGDGRVTMYQTRKMDKRKLNFTIGITATGAYVRGMPDLPVPPQSLSLASSSSTSTIHSAQNETSMKMVKLLPLWTDIHENHVSALWDLAVAAVFHLLAQRPGCTAAVIASAVKPALEEWEVMLILEWGERWEGVYRVELDEGGRGKGKESTRKGDGWTVGEWWWAALGSNVQEEVEQ